MADVRMTMAEVAASDDVDRARVAATTEAEVQRYMREDGEVPDGDGEQDIYNVSAATVRARTGLSQTAFAEAIGLPVATWRNWEQGRTRIEPAGVALLRLLAADPVGAVATLRRTARGVTTFGRDLIASAKDARGAAEPGRASEPGEAPRPDAARFVAFSAIDGEPWEAGADAAALLERVRSLSALGIGLTRCTEILDCGAEADEVVSRAVPLDEARRRFRTVFRGKDCDPGLKPMDLPAS